MTADIGALARQLTDMQIHGVCKDIREEGFTGLRGSMLSALHGTIAQASQLAYLILEFDAQHPRCGCGEPAIGHDQVGAPICAGCRALEAAALEELAAVEVADVRPSLPVQSDGTDR